MSLTSPEIARYQRHFALPQVGRAGQETLKARSVLLIGAGGLGAPLSLYLTASGVGRVGLVDSDVVDESNLQRQVLFDTPSVGRPKAEVAAERLRALNPHVEVEIHPTRLSSDNALDLMASYDVIADGTDNFPTRYLINDACVLLGKPNVYGSIFRFEGQVSIFSTPGGPCYRCLYETPPPPELVPSCAEGGVFGVLPGLIGTIQATEVLKSLLGIGSTLAGRLLLVDALSMHFRSVRVPRNPACPMCGDQPTITGLMDYEAFCNGASHSAGTALPSLTPAALMERIDSAGAPLLLDVRTEDERAESSIGGVLIPLADLRARIREIAHARNSEVVVYCQSGARSAQAVRILLDYGFENVSNLEGGLLAWQREQLIHPHRR